jgi:hypothetical protein
VPAHPWLALVALLAAAPEGAPDPPPPGDPEDILASELAAGGDDALWARAGLALRATGRAAIPSTAVLFDAAASAFATGRYLAPGPAEWFASGLAFVAAGWQATPWLGFRLDLDSGLVRSTRFPATASVCATRDTPSGLQVADGAQCIGALRFPLSTTAEDPARITSNGQPFANEASQTLFVRQLYADVQVGKAGLFRAKVGRERLRVADGLIYDDWGLGVDLDLDLGAVGPPLAIGLSVFYPTRGWPSGPQWAHPVVAGTVEWIPSLGEWLGVWGAFSSDPGGDAYAILQQGFVESEVARLGASAPGSAEYVRASRSLAVLLTARPQGSSTLGWAGISGRLEVGSRNEARFTAGVAVGTVGAQLNLVGAPARVDVPVLGWMASLRWTSQPGSGFTVSPFLVWMTGEDGTSAESLAAGTAGTWSGFLAVSPFITATNLFFQGGIAEAYADRRATASGVNARGVVAPGVEVGWSPGAGVELALKAAWLWADRVGPAGGASYGPEVDLNVSWSPTRWLAVLAEADVLALGNFFPGPAVARQFILGVNLVTP